MPIQGQRSLSQKEESSQSYPWIGYEESEDSVSEFCFMTIEEEWEEDFERAFQELYVETIYLAKKNKELKEQLEAITKK